MAKTRLGGDRRPAFGEPEPVEQAPADGLSITDRIKKIQQEEVESSQLVQNLDSRPFGALSSEVRQNAPVAAMVQHNLSKKILERIEVFTDAAGQFFDDLRDGNQKAKEHFRKNWMTPEVMSDMEKRNAKMLAEHIEFQRFRIFARAHEYQQYSLTSKARRLYKMAGRRAGKTEGNILDAMDQLARNDRKVLIIGLTFDTCSALYWHQTLKLVDELDLPIMEKKQMEGSLRLSNGSYLKLTGNSTADEREKLRGGNWDLIIVDEVQSQKALPYLIRDVLEPMLLDRKGRLVLSGTGPRTRGTLWEKLWLDDHGAQKLNWNITNNPFIPDHDTILAQIRADKAITENDPLYLREYLGKIAYDDDALVVRMTDKNICTKEHFMNWVASQPRTDIRFIAGLDFGQTDSDAFPILCYSESKMDVFLLYQHKMSRSGLETLAKGISDGLDFLRADPMFQQIPRDAIDDMFIFADTNEQRAANSLATDLKLNIYPAIKHDKAASLLALQEDVRKGNFKLVKSDDDFTPFEDEAMKTVFARDDADRLTTEIDDDAYHPDMIPAVIYACRSGPWLYRNRLGS